MALASSNSTKILEVCEVRPASDLTEPAKQLSLPLTFLDVLWLKFSPVERLFYYQLSPSTVPADTLKSTILPKLKHSLSLALLHFLPLVGCLSWPPDSPKPIILYSPNDGILLTVAESDADFDRLSSNEMIDAAESRPYVPELPISETASSVLALQITLFPSKGFTIGYASNHAVLDGRSITMFMKAWSYICKHDSSNLPPDQDAPFYDRNVIKDPSNLESVFLSQWAELTEPESKKNPRSLKVLPAVSVAIDQVRCIYQLNREDINKIRKKVMSETSSAVYLSTFVVTCAYVSVCMVRARGGDENRKVWFVFAADCRIRLDPPLPVNYFGNCLSGRDFITEAREFMEENGLSIIGERISSMVKGLDDGVLEGIDNILLKFKNVTSEDVQGLSVAGSIKFGLYGCDFGWGKPEKVEVTSIDRTGAIALSESRDGDGVEIGLVLPRHEMEAFSCIFYNGLKDL